VRIRARPTARRITGSSSRIAGSSLYGSGYGVADVPAPAAVGRATPVDVPARRVRAAPLLAVPVAGALLALWLIADPRTPDLAAQVYRVGLFGHAGFAVFDAHWYAGHHLPGYSLLFPPLASLLGLRLVAVLCVLASAALFERIVLTAYGASARWGAVAFAVIAVGDVWMGRLAFAMGVSLALAAVLALVRGRVAWAGALAALCAAASPVAGVLLALAGVTHALYQRSPRSVLVLAVPTCAVVAALALLFPEGGTEPYPTLSFAATALVVLAFLWALPAPERLLRVGALVYLLACVLCLTIHSPVGSNIERYGVLLAGPLLVCAVARRGASERRPGVVTALALCAVAVWVAWGPVRETLAVAGNESTRASYYAPVERFLARATAPPATPVRVEVPFTRSHWEAALLAPTVSLARGWEKQLDRRFDGVLLAPGLTAAGYERWLQAQAVAYVALPDTPLDPSSAQEGRLIRRGLPYLRRVFASRHWILYSVLDPTPIASGPGRLTSLGNDSFTLHASSPGRFLVRVHFTPYWTLARGAGCVAPAASDWTSVTVRAPGTVVVAARFSLARALGLGSSCSGEAGRR
jgi:hypothetical protein